MKDVDKPLAIVSRSEGWAYIPIPKCACTSVQRALEYHLALEPTPNVHGRDWPEAVLAEELRSIPELFAFTFIRDPLDRLISTWAEKCEDKDKPGLAPIFRDHCESAFSDFAKAAAKSLSSDEKANKHLAPQSYFIPEGFACRAYIIPHDVESRWPVLMSRFGFPPLRRHNVSSCGRTVAAWQDMTERTIQTVRDTYREDYERWFQ